jgi:hypothetical protein
MSQAHIEAHHGWVTGSKAASRYISVFADAADRELAKVHGVDVSEEEPDPVGPRECPRCERETPRDEDLCMWCGQALEHGAVERLERDEEEVRRFILRAAREDPSLLEEAETREDMLDKLEQSPELLQAARDFIDAQE